MKKLNIAKLLKDCPKGMELDCTNYDGIITFERVTDNPSYPIVIKVTHGANYVIHILTKYGQTCETPYNKCIIFPKGKTTWEGFQKPFKDGDVFRIKSGKYYLCIRNVFDEFGNIIFHKDDTYYSSEDGYLIPSNSNVPYRVKYCVDEYFRIHETKTLEKLIEPKFKVGNRIKHKDSGIYCTLGEYSEGISAYRTNIGLSITCKDLEQWELVPNKFDITTLKPFDKVLTRANDNDTWVCNLYSHSIKDYYVVLNAELVPQCIPYDGNEHLLGTTNDCSEFYKTWEE